MRNDYVLGNYSQEIMAEAAQEKHCTSRHSNASAKLLNINIIY